MVNNNINKGGYVANDEHEGHQGRRYLRLVPFELDAESKLTLKGC